MDDLMPCIDKLPDDKATLQRMVSTLEQIVLQQQKTINQQAEQIKYLQHRPKPVPINPNQPTLFDDEPLPEPPPPEAPQPEPPVKKKAKKKGHGRQRLSEHLPREIVTHTLSDAERACPCCGDLRNEIGEEISEKVDFQPAKAIVIQHVRKKYGCSKCLQTKAEQVNQVDETPSVIDIAPPPPSVIPKSLAEPGMLAQVIVSKFADHLPVYRQVSMLGRLGVHLSRQTVCDWLAACAQALLPLYQYMLGRVLESRVIHCDETRVPVWDIGQTRSGRLWIYLGDRDHPFTVYDYRPNKARAGPAEILQNYRGYLHADAANVFDGLYHPGAIVEVGCWAHARRHVESALESEPLEAAEGLARIGILYDVEQQIASELEQRALTGAEADAFVRAQRQLYCVPRLQSMRQWLDQLAPRLLPKSPMGKACTYIRRHWQALTRYTTEGFLGLDNNAAERGFRPIGIGRRNWLFAGSDAGGQTAAVLYSIVQTCLAHQIEPWQYLKDTLAKLPITPPDQIEHLLPVPGK